MHHHINLLFSLSFWILSAIAVIAAIFVVVSKHAVYSVLSLIVVFAAITGHYILLNAQFLAVVNIIVYAGAIMVLFLFVVMLMDLRIEQEKRNKYIVWCGTILCLIFIGFIVNVIYNMVVATKEIKGVISVYDIGNIGLVGPLGLALFRQFVLPFEITSVLFLSAMIGAVVIGKK